MDSIETERLLLREFKEDDVEEVHKYASDLELHRIHAKCDTRNTLSARVLEKVVMKQEGKLREHKLIDEE